MLAPAKPSSKEIDKEGLSPLVATSATSSSSMEEEPGPDRPATPPAWECGGSEGTQQVASPASDGCQTDPGPSPCPPSIVPGTSEDLRPPKRRPPPGDSSRSEGHIVTPAWGSSTWMSPFTERQTVAPVKSQADPAPTLSSGGGGGACVEPCGWGPSSTKEEGLVTWPLSV